MRPHCKFQASNDSGKGRYCGLGLTPSGHLVTAKTEKTSCCIKIFNTDDGGVVSTIDSYGYKLKRPSGVCVGAKSDQFLYLVDLGADVVRKYRYK